MKQDLTIKDVQAQLKCSRTTVDRLIKRGKLKAYRLSEGMTGSVRITAESMDALRAGK